MAILSTNFNGSTYAKEVDHSTLICCWLAYIQIQDHHMQIWVEIHRNNNDLASATDNIEYFIYFICHGGMLIGLNGVFWHFRPFFVYGSGWHRNKQSGCYGIQSSENWKLLLTLLSLAVQQVVMWRRRRRWHYDNSCLLVVIDVMIFIKLWKISP